MWAKAVDKCENASEPCNGMAQRHWARHKLHNGRISLDAVASAAGRVVQRRCAEALCRGVVQRRCAGRVVQACRTGVRGAAQGCVMTRSATLRSDVPRPGMGRARAARHQGRLAPQPVDPPVAVPEDEDVLPLRLSSSCSFC